MDNILNNNFHNKSGSENSSLMEKSNKIGKILVFALWAAIIVFMVLHKDSISIESITAFTAENWILAVLVLLSLFALKGVCMVIYSGLLYAASGMLLPLPLAIVVNIVGTALMVTIPYFLTRFIGGNAADTICKKYPKAASFLKRHGQSDFVFSMVLRFIYLIPTEAASIYLTAVQVKFIPFLLGSIVGSLPSIILFPIMGTNLSDYRSPEFVVAFCIQLAFILASIVAVAIHRKRSPKVA